MKLPLHPCPVWALSAHSEQGSEEQQNAHSSGQLQSHGGGGVFDLLQPTNTLQGNKEEILNALQHLYTHLYKYLYTWLHPAQPNCLQPPQWDTSK